ncbi:hypothetical protein DVH24_028904 [Malus domestica]|uniref:Guanosine nucleotide diphosphate dissociation inhibitor n=1 Tax=Malus domestica TaxID=3750 RepID=A0A498HZ38_MALDO|nr:hypothetical protein DVH24_028904 [Malus domestica]
MDEEYDVIVLGTGLKECILSGLLSVDGLKVLHMDRNDYYGGECASLNLVQLWKRFRGDDKPPAHLGSSRDYNVDMVPKFMMANGTLVRVLIHTDVTKYLYFKAVDGSFVYNKGKVHKVPATDMEALKSPLMGLFEKRRARKFFIYVQDYNETDPKTHEGMNLTRVTTRDLIAKYGLDDNTVDFIGHALALHRDDRYLNEPALDTVKRMKLYAESLARFQGGSPYIYPLYGLGELPQAFARLSAVYGGTYMLNKPECKVEFNEEGKVVGVTSEGETAKCKKVVCDPSYLPNKVRKVGKVARAIAIMSHPIPNTNESHSVQVILPQKQLGRRSDMYLFCCSYSHNVAPKGKFIAFVSTDAETDHPETELRPGIDLLGPVDEIFFEMYDRYEPVNEPTLDNCFISTSYDATTHFESTVMDVLNMYTLITGKNEATELPIHVVHMLPFNRNLDGMNKKLTVGANRPKKLTRSRLRTTSQSRARSQQNLSSSPPSPTHSPSALRPPPSLVVTTPYSESASSISDPTRTRTRTPQPGVLESLGPCAVAEDKPGNLEEINSERSHIGNVFNKLLKQIGNPVDFELPDWFNKWKPMPYTFIKRNIYHTKRIKRRLEDDGIFCSCNPSLESSSVCGRDCHCGMLLSSCSSACKCGSSCLNKPFQHRPVKKMKLVKTEKCGSGIVADEDIKQGEFVIEYVGEVIDDKTCEQRLWNMKHRGETNFYLCEINRDMVIDATYKGNKSRYINHSCCPNTEMQKWIIDGETRIDQDCHCGAIGCRRKLGVKPTKSKISSDAALKLVACQVAVSSPKLKAIISAKDEIQNPSITKAIDVLVIALEKSFGIIKRFDKYSRKHSIMFEDGGIEFLDMSKEDWELKQGRLVVVGNCSMYNSN